MRSGEVTGQEILREFHFEVRIRGKIRAPGPRYAESQVRAGVMLSLNVHDVMDDLSVVIQQDPFDRMREGLR